MKKSCLLDFQIKNRLLEFFFIKSMECECCGELGVLSGVVEDNEELTPQDFGIRNKEHWEAIIDDHLKWCFANKNAVLRTICKMEKQGDYEDMCHSLRETLKNCPHY